MTFAITAGDAFAALDPNGTTLSLTAAGTVEVTATQAGDANYAAVTQTQTITVQPPPGMAQTITFDNNPDPSVGQTIPLVAMTDAPDAAMLVVTFTSSNAAVAEIVGGMDGDPFPLKLIGVGDVTITAIQVWG